jgi:hypothetical protein
MNHYNQLWSNRYRISLGQESVYYQDYIKYCNGTGVPLNEWVRKNNHIKMAW